MHRFLKHELIPIGLLDYMMCLESFAISVHLIYWWMVCAYILLTLPRERPAPHRHRLISSWSC